MIGVFDSGFGGLTVLKELLCLLPQYSYLYLGDSARAPYGNRSQEVIYGYVQSAVDFLVGRGCSLIILACNTASAEALRKIQQEYLPQKYPTVKVLGVIRPAVEVAIETSSKKIIGVVGTRATVLSEAYVHELQELDPNAQVFQQACPLLVPLIEEGWEHKPETCMILKKYLVPLKSTHMDTLILGCTHYPILQKEFERKLGKNVRMISSSQAAATKLVDYLQRHPDVEKKLEKEGKLRFCTTDDGSKFQTLGSRFLGRMIRAREVEVVKI